MTVTQGAIPRGAEVIVEHHDTQQLRLATVHGYIPHTDSYLCDVGGDFRAVPAQKVMRRVPKFTSIEEADAWLEGR
jgi:hypothetical protein